MEMKKQINIFNLSLTLYLQIYIIKIKSLMQASREEKQKFLVQEIIDKGYDAQDFQEYLLDNNGTQINLDSWDFPNLKKFVYQYQQSKKPKSQKSQQSSSSNSEKKEQQEGENKQEISSSAVIAASSSQMRKQEQVKQTGQYLEFNYQTKQETFSQIIDCIQIPPNQLLNKDVEIKITRYQKKQGGIFEHSYYTYIVQTPCLGKTVQRRYNDFQWLKETLEFHHPGLPVPPIAKKGQFRRSDDKHLNKRRMILQMFLNELVQIPEIKADQIFQNFLKFNDLVMFEKFKSDYKRTANIQLTKVRNTRGKLNITIDPKVNNFLVKSQRHIFDIQPMTKKIFKDFKGVATLLQQASNVLMGISQLCQELDLKDRQFRQEVELKYCSSNMYTILMESSKNLGELLTKQAKSFRTQIYQSIKYQSLNLLNTLQAFDRLKAFQQQYIQTKNVLFKKKERLFEEGNMAKWGLNVIPPQKPERNQAIKMILPKQTQDLSRLRISYGLRNFLMFEEINRHFTKNNQYLAKFLIKYSRIQSQIASQLMMVWVDAQTAAMGMQEGKSIKSI